MNAESKGTVERLRALQNQRLSGVLDGSLAERRRFAGNALALQAHLNKRRTSRMQVFFAELGKRARDDMRIRAATWEQLRMLLPASVLAHVRGVAVVARQIHVVTDHPSYRFLVERTLGRTGLRQLVRAQPTAAVVDARVVIGVVPEVEVEGPDHDRSPGFLYEREAYEAVDAGVLDPGAVSAYITGQLERRRDRPVGAMPPA